MAIRFSVKVFFSIFRSTPSPVRRSNGEAPLRSGGAVRLGDSVRLGRSGIATEWGEWEEWGAWEEGQRGRGEEE